MTAAEQVARFFATWTGPIVEQWPEAADQISVVLDALEDTPTETARWKTQTILASDENKARGIYGNCLQASVASVLDMPLDAVPNFALFLWWPQALRLWARGLDLAVRTSNTQTIPERLCIVGGKSPRVGTHAVVGGEGRILWDPHPSRDGLASVTDLMWFEPIGPDDYECMFYDQPCVCARTVTTSRVRGPAHCASREPEGERVDG